MGRCQVHGRNGVTEISDAHRLGPATLPLHTKTYGKWGRNKWRKDTSGSSWAL